LRCVPILTRSNITVNIELDEAKPQGVANGSEVQQLLLNLLINADKALTTVPERRPSRSEQWPATTRFGASCRRHRAGIPPDIQEKIFDPFFTTKRKHGTGLGLSICYADCARPRRPDLGALPAGVTGRVPTVSLPRDAAHAPAFDTPTDGDTVEARESDVALSCC